MPVSTTKTNTVHIPASAADLTKLFDRREAQIDGLVTARNWVRALVVWTFCDPMPGTRTSPENREGDTLTFTEFAKLGIHGLTHADTVASYYKVANKAITDGDVVAPARGETVPIPDLKWPGSGKKSDSSVPVTAAKQYKRAADLVIASKEQLTPEMRRAVLEAAERIVTEFR